MFLQFPWVRRLRAGSFRLERGGGLGGGTSVTIFSKLVAYARRFNTLSPSIESMNNPSSRLTNVYLNTHIVGPTPDPLDYVHLPGPLG